MCIVCQQLVPARNTSASHSLLVFPHLSSCLRLTPAEPPRWREHCISWSGRWKVPDVGGSHCVSIQRTMLALQPPTSTPRGMTSIYKFFVPLPNVEWPDAYCFCPVYPCMRPETLLQSVSHIFTKLKIWGQKVEGQGHSGIKYAGNGTFWAC